MVDSEGHDDNDDEQTLTRRVSDVAYGTDGRATASTGVLGLGMIGTATLQFDNAVTAFSHSATWVLATAGPNGIGEALCEVGVGQLVSAGLYLAAVYLAYLTIADLFSAMAASNSRSSGSQNERRDALRGAGAKGFGAVLIAGSPTILAGLGFSLLGCVDAVNIFNGVILFPV